MIRWLMELAISGRAVIIGLAIALLLSGIYAFSQLDIEAYPDPVQPMVELLTLPNGLSAEEVERLVTVPLEYTLSSTRNLEGTLLRWTWKFAVVNTQSTSSFDRGLLRTIQIVAAHRHQRGLRRWANCFGK